MFFLFPKKRFFCLKLFAVIFVLLIACGYGLFVWVRNMTPEQLLEIPIVQEQLKKKVGNENLDLVNFFPKFLGFKEPMTYLVLLQNNMEIRPAGGFIGTYAVMKINKGSLEIVKFDGTENLDNQAPAGVKIAPPSPMQTYLRINNWQFRDSNWSPDFAISAQKALDFYTAENGMAANEINMVVGINLTVLEKILEINGPVKVGDMEFGAENVSEDLEYEVEYGYVKKGIPVQDRKKIVKSFFLALTDSLQKEGVWDWQAYLGLIQQMLLEKQITFYAINPELQKELESMGWTGQMKSFAGDYLLWADANLSALKTDRVMKRRLSYTLIPQIDGRFLAKAEMTYIHNGGFDWRTTRYRTYARVYVPLGSEFISSEGAMVRHFSKEIGSVDQGHENNRQWFGAYIAIEPGKTGKLSFSYLLPLDLSIGVANGEYSLLVQKQIGTLDNGLTLDLNFGKNISSAVPAELEKEFGDRKYVIEFSLEKDAAFQVKF